MKKVGILGSAMVGKSLAKGFIANGYETYISSRNPEKRAALEEEFNCELKALDPIETAAAGDIIVLAIKGNQAKAALEAIGTDLLFGKTIIDATNPISDEDPENGVLRYSSSINKSLMEELQEIAPDANFVKAFSCVGNAHMVNPNFKETPSMFICGNSDEAKSEVKDILDKFGWEAIDLGKVQAARAIEPLAMLWCIPGFLENNWDHAFKLLKK